MTKKENFNKANLVGRLGKDPELLYFASGSVVAKTTLAVDRTIANEDDPDWFSVEAWGKTAEILASYTTKGSLVAVEGEFKLDEWLDKQTNQPRLRPSVKISRLHLLSSPSQVRREKQLAVAVNGSVDGAYDEEDF